MFRRLILTLLVFSLAAPVQAARTLYLIPDFTDPTLADSALGLIQCVFTKAEVPVEVTERAQAGFPQLALTQTGAAVTTELRRHAEHAEPLGMHPASALSDAFCEILLEKLASPEPRPESNRAELAPLSVSGAVGAAPLTETSVSPSSAKDSFWKRSWPYFAIAGVIVGGFFLIRGKNEAPAAPTTHESRGYVIR